MWMSAAHTVEVGVSLWAVSFSVGVHIKTCPFLLQPDLGFHFLFFPEDD